MAKQQLFYNTKYRYTPTVSGKEKNELPSKTVQGEVLEMRDILRRAMSGQQPVMKEVPYFDEEDMEKIDKFFAPGTLDFTDLGELARRTRELEDMVNKAINERDEREKQRKADEAADKRAAEKKAAEENAAVDDSKKQED